MLSKLRVFWRMLLLAAALSVLLGVKVSPWWIPLPFVLYTAMFLVALPRVEAWQRAIDFFRLIVVIGAYIVTAIIVDADFRGNREFFAVTAQVIPVLPLALAVEARTLGSFYDRGEFQLALIIVVALAVGEIESLRALASKDPTHFDGWASASAVAAGFAGVLAAGLASIGRDRSRVDRAVVEPPDAAVAPPKPNFPLSSLLCSSFWACSSDRGEDDNAAPDRRFPDQLFGLAAGGSEAPAGSRRHQLLKASPTMKAKTCRCIGASAGSQPTPDLQADDERTRALP